MRSRRFADALVIGGLVVGGLTVGAAPALADQCAWISKKEATTAALYLKRGVRFLTYCEPCGERAPEEHVIETVEVKAVEGGRYREVYLNGEPVDLAYVFVEQGPSEFKNLSKLAKCKSTGVSESIRSRKAPASTSVASGRAAGFPGKYALAFGRSTLVVAGDSMGTGYVLHLELHGDKGEQVVIGGPLDEQGPEARLFTPLGSCALVVTYDEGRDAVRLKSEPGCRGLLQSAEGLYTRADDDAAKR